MPKKKPGRSIKFDEETYRIAVARARKEQRSIIVVLRRALYLYCSNKEIQP